MARFLLSAFADEADALLSGQIEALREAGIAQVEIRGVNGKNISQLTEGEAREARAMLDGAGIRVSSLGSPYGKIGIEDDFAPHLELMKRGLEIAKILGTEHIRMFSFYIPAGKKAEEYREEVLARLEQMLDAARDAGVELLHENEKGIYGDTDDRCLDLLTAFGGRLLGVFDPANFIQCGVKPAEAMRKLKDHIVYMHIKDALLADGSVVPCGMGDGSLPELLSQMALRADGMTLSVEPHLAVFQGLENLQGEQVRHKYVYPTAREAFAAAADALKETLKGIGFRPMEGREGTWIR